MANTGPDMISSSPLRQLASYSISSPLLPSLDEIFKQKNVRGSNIAPIPTGTATTFASASTLLRNSSFGSFQGIGTARSLTIDAVQDANETEKSAKPKVSRKAAGKKDDGSVEKVAKAPRKTAKKKDEGAGRVVEGSVKEVVEVVAKRKPRKSRAKKGDDIEGEGEGVADTIVPGFIESAVEKKTRKPRAKKGDDVAGEVVKEKVPRKPRAKKIDVEPGSEIVPKEKAVKKADGDTNLQPKMVQGKVTKTANFSNTEKVKVQKAETVSKHFSVNPIIEEEIIAEDGSGLVEAIKRRKNWTPPKPTQVPIAIEDSPADDGLDTSSKGFTDLLRNFGYSSNEANTIDKSVTSGVSTGAAATRKRKLIEMVTTNIPPTSGTKVTKQKAVKKKARTITDLATSAYAKDEDNCGTDLDASAPLLQYFPQAGSGGVTSGGFKIPPKPRSKSPAKGKKRSADEPILLSPESALEQVGKQDFVFGTSSQLAREDSPSLLRDLHDAMQASNELDDCDDPFVSPPTKIAERAKRNLWSVAARDDNGDLMDIETVDVVHTPIAKPRDRIILSQNPSSSWITPAKDEWLDIDESEEDRPPSTQVPTRQMGPIEMSINLELLNSSKDGSSSPKKKATKSSMTTSATPKKIEASSMPAYESFTTPQLLREIKKYKFKAIKSRKRMIDLLIQCYESQNRPALGILQGNLPIAVQKPLEKSKDVASSSTHVDASISSPQRGRGRLKKSTTATIATSKPKSKAKPKVTETVASLETDSDTPLSKTRTPKRSKKGREPLEDISNPDPPSTPSSPRRSPSRSQKASKARESSPTDVDQDDEVQQVQLFAHISTAITSAPPSQDASSPSWHEKILLYDPIVLEDLASWLNTGALGKVGWDDEVDPKEVKKWCESKSICCLWKERQGGRARSRI
ncbi:hypothetical protein DSL72_006238 [Monilinia vaccinii-corymbosi]|uniref:Structure-specific endonuclease subunit SLX4 n=1 Tax=Monilinia vaccinii-corymbosi TaxID=61207 RepID=A0A8A3PLQ7_9HELO|nr:hypothetical protein DSL72_006238 [Monilinia vaccinii-corymbosi]